MSQQRLPMRKVRDVLRLKAVGLGKRKIAASLGISATAVGGCLLPQQTPRRPLNSDRFVARPSIFVTRAASNLDDVSLTDMVPAAQYGSYEETEIDYGQSAA